MSIKSFTLKATFAMLFRNKELKQRWKTHKNSYNEWLKGKKSSSISIYPYFEQHGIEQFKMILIKSYDVCDRTHLEAYEALWVNKLKPINKNNPFYIKRLSQKAYHNANRDRLCEYQKEYRQVNEDTLKAKTECPCGGKYSHGHSARHFKLPKHQQWVDNKETIRVDRKAKHDCECGGKYTHAGRCKHLRTKKHTDWLTAQQ